MANLTRELPSWPCPGDCLSPRTKYEKGDPIRGAAAGGAEKVTEGMGNPSGEGSIPLPLLPNPLLEDLLSSGDSMSSLFRAPVKTKSLLNQDIWYLMKESATQLNPWPHRWRCDPYGTNLGWDCMSISLLYIPGNP
jgi:hypothetical protein